MNMAVLPGGSMLATLTGAAAVAAKAWTHPGVPVGPASSMQSLGPVALVAVAYVCLLYTLLFNQSRVAFAEHARQREEAKASDTKPASLRDVKYSGKGAVLDADRAVGNLLEQSLPFLVSLLAHAALVDAAGAARCGWVWIVCRLVYPFAFRLPFPGVLMSTVPAYAIIAYMLATAVVAV